MIHQAHALQKYKSSLGSFSSSHNSYWMSVSPRNLSNNHLCLILMTHIILVTSTKHNYINLVYRKLNFIMFYVLTSHRLMLLLHGPQQKMTPHTEHV